MFGCECRGGSQVGPHWLTNCLRDIGSTARGFYPTKTVQVGSDVGGSRKGGRQDAPDAPTCRWPLWTYRLLLLLLGQRDTFMAVIRTRTLPDSLSIGLRPES